MPYRRSKAYYDSIKRVAVNNAVGLTAINGLNAEHQLIDSPNQPNLLKSLYVSGQIVLASSAGTPLQGEVRVAWVIQRVPEGTQVQSVGTAVAQTTGPMVAIATNEKKILLSGVGTLTAGNLAHNAVLNIKAETQLQRKLDKGDRVVLNVVANGTGNGIGTFALLGYSIDVTTFLKTN